MYLSEGAVCRLVAFHEVPEAEHVNTSWTPRKSREAGLGCSTERFFRWASQRETCDVDTLARDADVIHRDGPLDEFEERQLALAVRDTRCPLALSRLERSHRVRVLLVASAFSGGGVGWPTLVTEARRAFFDAISTFNFDSSNTLSRWVEASLRGHLESVVARSEVQADHDENPCGVRLYSYGSGAA